MEETIINLRKRIEFICEEYCDFNRVDLTEKACDLINEVKDFSIWFISADNLGIDADIKQQYNNDILSILKDINQAIERHDSALMYDALYCGLLEYLMLFDLEDESVE